MGTVYASSFSAVGQSSELSIGDNDKISLALVSTSWTGNTVSLQKLIGAGCWDNIATYTANYEGIVQNLKKGHYRLNCTAKGGDDISYSFGDADDTVEEFLDNRGNVILKITENGIRALNEKFKDPVICASTANGTLATAYVAGQTVDGVTLAKDDRILLKNQTSGAENGIYIVNTIGAPSRADDADTAEKLIDAIVPVRKGTVNADKVFKVTNDTLTLGTTSIVLAEIKIDTVWKEAVVCATTANGTLATAFANGQTVDGITLVTGDRILIKNQSSAAENGIYVVAASGAPSRASDGNTAEKLLDAIIPVRKGTVNADKVFKITNDTITLASTSITFAEIKADTVWKEAVRVATTTNGTLATAYANGQTVDGITLATGDRILIKDQTAGEENGIYTVNAAGAPTRASDANTSDKLLNALIPVFLGTVNANRIYKITNASTITIDTTALTFSLISGLKKLIIPAGLGKVGATAGWVPATTDDLALATLPQSQTNSTLIIPIIGLKAGDKIVKFSAVGQIESAGNTATLDIDLRKLTAADGDVADASVKTMTQISVTADDTIEEANSETTLTTPEIVGDNETFYMVVKGTTAASTDIALQAVKVEVE